MGHKHSEKLIIGRHGGENLPTDDDSWIVYFLLGTIASIRPCTLRVPTRTERVISSKVTSKLKARSFPDIFSSASIRVEDVSNFWGMFVLVALNTRINPYGFLLGTILTY